MIPQVTFDPDVNILSIRLRKAKGFESDIKDNIVFDYDRKGHLVNIEVMEIDLETIAKSKPLKMVKKNGKFEVRYWKSK